uniref:Nop domain-containing protein n=1 Tax=Ditylenchus dipsaci TaxID=166011 RepID=A0A915D548_9BILA
MLVLFETSAGYALFKMLDESKLKKIEVISEEFSSAEKAQENLQLVSFKKFKDVDDAVKNISSMQEGSLSNTLKKMLKSKVLEEGNLVVGDSKISNLIKERLEGIKCVHNSATAELMRGIRCHMDVLLADYATELKAMRLALAHALGRYKVKFNPEKIDTMITQAVLLLDDLDKELNNYVMRCREWYGWHFPELGKIVQDPIAYVKTIKAIGKKQNSVKVDLSSILPEDLSARVNQEAEMSMGSDISDLDILLISELCDQIIEVSGYRTQLNEYLKNRMHALAPNVTVLLGELVGARLISKAGSLVGLAKCPSSTVQLLGPRRPFDQQAATNLKGKVARKLAAKVSLASRIDALREESSGNEME